jgi:hypothetical protein
MSDILMTARPLTDVHGAFLLLQDSATTTRTFSLEQGQRITISLDPSAPKRCTGWYDIATHENHVCETSANVDEGYDSCFACRNKTNFNPAFYNASSISSEQEAYNLTPHSVYVAYFGGELAKAGIMADSRGRERIYEQGALWYAYLGSYENATVAHNLEEKLIKKGLRNSVSKRQKDKVLASRIDIAAETRRFHDTLAALGIDTADATCNLDHFFFGSYPGEPVLPIGDNPLSGTVVGIVGRYLVLENNDRLYGMWLSNLFGRTITITDTVVPIDAAPMQTSLF